HVNFLCQGGVFDCTHSPFVIAFSSAGIKGIPSVMNAIILTSAFSSGNACTFLASRTLHGLALDGHAPSIFLSLNRFGTPYVAVAVSVIWGAIAYTGLNQGSSQAFVWLVALATTAGIISWIIYYALVMNVLILIFSGWNSFTPTFNFSSFASNYLNCIIFPILFILCKIWLRDRMPALDAIDIRSELDSIQLEPFEDGHAQEVAFKASLTAYDRFLNAIF
ncbi:hypothetical protein CVT25_008983, partial [Psilocybe cyanescens]